MDDKEALTEEGDEEKNEDDDGCGGFGALKSALSLNSGNADMMVFCMERRSIVKDMFFSVQVWYGSVARGTGRNFAGTEWRCEGRTMRFIYCTRMDRQL